MAQSERYFCPCGYGATSPEQADALRGQQATEQGEASQDRVGNLEAQLRQVPSLIQQEAKTVSPVTDTTTSAKP